ncbi:hypothetical protein AZE42_03379 [Rhizopogon vesiculosus]|uniref:Uncharacterized protein n=1 Tax=Rhizopogon vesiculosus TaxID=180088 RepID=A0A1J8QS82_9AGAM|nr:hypothetical protein AZE42_03379 [Rhizopogon vesiculosus]
MHAREASPSPYHHTLSTVPPSPPTTPSRIGDSTTSTIRIPSSQTHSPRNRICTPNKLITSTPTQPTLAMSLVAPTPRTPQRQGMSPHIQSPRSCSSPPARPSSRSECLLRNTLRKDDTRRTSATSRARSRSPSSCSDCDDDVFFQSALLINPSATSRPQAQNIQSKSFYIPNENEDSSYAQLLRSRSFSNSNSSGYPVAQVQQEKLDESLSSSLPRAYVLGSGAAPHEAVLRTRLERVLHRGMREERRRMKRSPDDECAQSSSASPPSLARSNSRTNSQASEKTHATAPEVEPLLPPSLSSKPGRTHRYPQSMSVTCVQTQKPPRSPRSPRSQRETSPWMTAPLPPSPTFSTPTKKSPSSPSRHSPNSGILSTFSSANSQVPVVPPQFDLRAASQACKQVSGYVSFASVAGLGAPPGVGDDDVSVKEAQRGRGLPRWWIF